MLFARRWPISETSGGSTILIGIMRNLKATPLLLRVSAIDDSEENYMKHDLATQLRICKVGVCIG